MSLRLGGWALAACLSFPLPRTANASRNFPDALKDEWQLPAAPPACTLCHQTLLGGFATATKPFGRAVMRSGATAVDVGALRTALRALERATSDVDRDGVSDFDELWAGTDPNVADVTGADAGEVAAAPDDTPIPRTGCSLVAVGSRTWLTATRPSPTVGPNSGLDAPSRRISGDALLVCGLILGAVTGRLRAQRKRMASSAR